VREVRKWDPPFFSFDVGVAFVRETVDSILASQVPLVELAIVVVGDFVSHLEEGREQGVLVVAVDHDWRFDGDEGHFRDGDRLRGGVVELYEVRFGLIRLRRVDRDVHNCARTKDVGEGVSLFNASAGGVRFVLAWAVIAVEVAEQAAIVLDVRVN
jgi:hypothetical protein